MEEILDFFEDYEGIQKKIMQQLHFVICEYPEVSGKIRYNIPFYYRNSWVCYINPKKNQDVDLGFIHGNKLSNEQNLLESKDRKQVKTITFSNVLDIAPESLREIILEAFFIDDELQKKRKSKA